MPDVTSISQFAQSQIAAEASVKVAVKAKDVVKQQGEAAISLLESAAELSKQFAIQTAAAATLALEPFRFSHSPLRDPAACRRDCFFWGGDEVGQSTHLAPSR